LKVFVSKAYRKKTKQSHFDNQQRQITTKKLLSFFHGIIDIVPREEPAAYHHCSHLHKVSIDLSLMIENNS
jgi:hypothetical protein